MKMKNFGNLVHKFCSAAIAAKYGPIVAASVEEFRAKQLTDLKRFLTEDYSEKADPAGNPTDYITNLRTHKKIIEKEIERLERILKPREDKKEKKEKKVK